MEGIAVAEWKSMDDAEKTSIDIFGSHRVLPDEAPRTRHLPCANAMRPGWQWCCGIACPPQSQLHSDRPGAFRRASSISRTSGSPRLTFALSTPHRSQAGRDEI